MADYNTAENININPPYFTLVSIFLRCKSHEVKESREDEGERRIDGNLVGER